MVDVGRWDNVHLISGHIGCTDTQEEMGVSLASPQQCPKPLSLPLTSLCLYHRLG